VKYLAATLRLQFRTTLTFRFDLAVTVLRNVLTVCCLFALWTALFTGRTAVAGIDKNTMILYAVASTILGVFLSMRVENNMAESIHKGNIALMLARPIAYPLSLFMDAVANTIVNAVTRIFPYLIAAVIGFCLAECAGMRITGWLVISIALSYILMFLYQVLFGSLVFWTMDIAGLIEYRDVVMMLFSGAIVPLYFFPDWLFRMAMFLPFQAIYHTPLSIMIGRIDGSDAAMAVGLQLAWIVVLSLIARLVWRRAVRRVIVHGG